MQDLGKFYIKMGKFEIGSKISRAQLAPTEMAGKYREHNSLLQQSMPTH